MIFESNFIDNFHKGNRKYTLLTVSIIAFIWVSFYLGFFLDPENQDRILSKWSSDLSFLGWLGLIAGSVFLFAFSFFILYILSLVLLVIIAAINYSYFWCLNKLVKSFPKIEFQSCLDISPYHFIILCILNLVLSIITKTPFLLSIITKLLESSPGN